MSFQAYMYKRVAMGKPSSQSSSQKDAVSPVCSLPMVTCSPSDEGPKVVFTESQNLRGWKGPLWVI